MTSLTKWVGAAALTTALFASPLAWADGHGEGARRAESRDTRTAEQVAAARAAAIASYEARKEGRASAEAGAED